MPASQDFSSSSSFRHAQSPPPKRIALGTLHCVLSDLTGSEGSTRPPNYARRCLGMVLCTLIREDQLPPPSRGLHRCRGAEGSLVAMHRPEPHCGKKLGGGVRAVPVGNTGFTANPLTMNLLSRPVIALATPRGLWLFFHPYSARYPIFISLNFNHSHVANCFSFLF